MTKYSVGLDIGIASVGWSIIDVDNKEIVDLGSRIFPSGNAAGNQDRRSFRGTRRLVRRRKNRLSDLTKLLAKNGFAISADKNQNPYALRVSGLTEQLSKEELATALYHIVNRRGISYGLGDLEDDGTSGVSDYKSSININRQLLREKTVGQIQLERLNEYGQVRGQVKADDEKTLLNVFPSSAYADEAKRILKKQAEYHPEITNEFIKKIIGLIIRKREYFVGPGSEKWPTPYGRFRIKNGKTIKIGENLFETLIGKDKLNDERVAPASSYTAQKFNLLNDLSNIRVFEPNDKTDENGKLTKDTKESIVKFIQAADKTINLKEILNFIFDEKIKVEDYDNYLSGLRVKQKKVKEQTVSEKIIHSMQGYQNFRKALAELDIELNDYPKYQEVNGFLDKMAYYLTLNSEPAEIKKQLKENSDFAEYQDFLSMGKDLVDKDTGEIIFTTVLDIIAKQNKKLLVPGNAKWHSFSYATLEWLINELLNTTKEQMQIITEAEKSTFSSYNFKGKKYISPDIATKDIYNPVVRTSVRESIKIFNALSKKYGTENIQHIVLELPREEDLESFYTDKKGKRVTLTAEKAKAARVKHANDVIAKINSEKETIKNEFEFEQHHNVSLKERLWFEQKGICPYCGKSIPKSEVISKFAGYEVDHIIPYSISNNDSKSNKVLVDNTCNQEKKARTPFGWGMFWSWSDFEKYVNTNSRFPKSKKNNLLSKVDLNSIETRKRFVARNINDTSYASKVVLNVFDAWISQNDLDIKKPKIVRGSWTHQMRTKWSKFDKVTNDYVLNKTRDTYHHHAIDASIIASFPLVHAFSDYVSVVDEVDEENKEISSTTEWKKYALANDVFKAKIAEITKYPLFNQLYQFNDIDNPENPVKFSHKINKKTNRAIVTKQTIYGTRIKETEVIKRGKKEIQKTEYTFGTIKNIYDVGQDSGAGVGGYKYFKKLLITANSKIEKDWRKLIDLLDNPVKVETKFLAQEKDPSTWKKLVEILKQYPETEEITQVDGKIKVVDVSPFELYRREYGRVKKYAKRDNGPEVVSIKFYANEYKGGGIDITHKHRDNIRDIESKNRVVLDGLSEYRTDIYYNEEKKKYEFLRLTHSDLQYLKGKKGRYGISESSYEALKHKIEVDGSIIWKPISQGSKFCFSLYTNDCFCISNMIEDKEVKEDFRFLGSSDNRIIFKPIDKDSFDKKKDKLRIFSGEAGRIGQGSFKDNVKLYKINTDILGTPYYTEKESDQPKLNL